MNAVLQDLQHVFSNLQLGNCSDHASFVTGDVLLVDGVIRPNSKYTWLGDDHGKQTRPRKAAVAKPPSSPSSRAARSGYC